ncbi:MAG: hypothetical protein M3Y48_24935 [Actinomycetota bacterium]|nr:hypothetical protein [Actinomycetota bacterium]
MLADSDDEIADRLWTAGGGPAIVTRMVGQLGLTGTQPPEDPGEWGDTLITAQDMVTVYRYISERVPGPDRDLLLGALSDGQHGPGRTDSRYVVVVLASAPADSYSTVPAVVTAGTGALAGLVSAAAS